MKTTTAENKGGEIKNNSFEFDSNGLQCNKSCFFIRRDNMFNDNAARRSFFKEIVENLQSLNFVNVLFRAIYDSEFEQDTKALNEMISGMFDAVWDGIHLTFNSLDELKRPSPEHLAACSVLSDLEEAASKINKAMELHYHSTELTRLVVGDGDSSRMDERSLQLILSALA